MARCLNDAILGTYPYLFGIGTSTFTPSVTGWSNSLPADAVAVLRVETQDPGTGDWDEIKAYETKFSADATTFPTGNGIILPASGPWSQTVRMVYAKLPEKLAAEADLFSATGLPASCKDLIVYGALARLTPAMDTSRLVTESAEADAMDSPRPIGSAGNVSKLYEAKYNQRLLMERTALLQKYPVAIHSVGV